MTAILTDAAAGRRSRYTALGVSKLHSVSLEMGKMVVERNKIIDVVEAYTAAWNSGSPEAVAEFYAADGWIVINRGDPWKGRARVAEMAAGFFADVPDLALVCDSVRSAGDHVVYCWTFTGSHVATKRQLRVSGWEEWDLDTDLKVKASLG